MLLAYVLYFALCLALAVMGRNRKFGFWGYLFASILFTPLIGAFIVLASDPRPEEAPRVRTR